MGWWERRRFVRSSWLHRNGTLYSILSTSAEVLCRQQGGERGEEGILPYHPALRKLSS